MMISRAYQAYRDFQPFTDAEAWMLFRLAAIVEAVGWTLLIIGVACERLPGEWGSVPVLLAGRTHGMLFLTYLVAAVVLAPSLGWSLRRTVVAGLASVPPYGSLLFEMWAARSRELSAFRTLRTLLHYRLAISEHPAISQEVVAAPDIAF